MGNTIPKASPPSYDLRQLMQQDLPQVLYQEGIGKGKFMKSVLGKYLPRDAATSRLALGESIIGIEGKVVVKVYVKRDKGNESGDSSARIADARVQLLYLCRAFNLYDQPSCLPYQRFGEGKEAAYLVRQHIAHNLRDRLHSRPFPTRLEKLWYAYQLIRAIAQSHSVGIRHGDIKSENCLITSWGWLFLTDFGLFKPAILQEDSPADFSFYFESGSRTRCYLAPERLLSAKDLYDVSLLERELSEGKSIANIQHEVTHGEGRIGKHLHTQFERSLQESRERGLPKAKSHLSVTGSGANSDTLDPTSEITAYAPPPVISTSLACISTEVAQGIPPSPCGPPLLRPSMDIFSVGCVLMEIALDGEAFFEQESMLAYKVYNKTSGGSTPSASTLNVGEALRFHASGSASHPSALSPSNRNFEEKGNPFSRAHVRDALKAIDPQGYYGDLVHCMIRRSPLCRPTAVQCLDEYTERPNTGPYYAHVGIEDDKEREKEREREGAYKEAVSSLYTPVFAGESASQIAAPPPVHLDANGTSDASTSPVPTLATTPSSTAAQPSDKGNAYIVTPTPTPPPPSHWTVSRKGTPVPSATTSLPGLGSKSSMHILSSAHGHGSVWPAARCARPLFPSCFPPLFSFFSKLIQPDYASADMRVLAVAATYSALVSFVSRGAVDPLGDAIMLHRVALETDRGADVVAALNKIKTLTFLEAEALGFPTRIATAGDIVSFESLRQQSSHADLKKTSEQRGVVAVHRGYGSARVVPSFADPSLIAGSAGGALHTLYGPSQSRVTSPIFEPRKYPPKHSSHSKKVSSGSQISSGGTPFLPSPNLPYRASSSSQTAAVLSPIARAAGAPSNLLAPATAATAVSSTQFPDDTAAHWGPISGESPYFSVPHRSAAEVKMALFRDWGIGSSGDDTVSPLSSVWTSAFDDVASDSERKKLADAFTGLGKDIFEPVYSNWKPFYWKETEQTQATQAFASTSASTGALNQNTASKLCEGNAESIEEKKGTAQVTKHINKADTLLSRADDLLSSLLDQESSIFDLRSKRSCARTRKERTTALKSTVSPAQSKISTDESSVTAKKETGPNALSSESTSQKDSSKNRGHAGEGKSVQNLMLHAANANLMPTESYILIVQLLTASLRHVQHPRTKITAIMLIARLSVYADDTTRLDHALPCLAWQLDKETCSTIRSHLFVAMTVILENTKSISPAQSMIFPLYIRPLFERALKSAKPPLSTTVVACFPRLVRVAKRFIEIAAGHSQRQSISTAAGAGLGSKAPIPGALSASSMTLASHYPSTDIPPNSLHESPSFSSRNLPSSVPSLTLSNLGHASASAAEDSQPSAQTPASFSQIRSFYGFPTQRSSTTQIPLVRSKVDGQTTALRIWAAEQLFELLDTQKREEEAVQLTLCDGTIGLFSAVMPLHERLQEEQSNLLMEKLMQAVEAANNAGFLSQKHGAGSSDTHLWDEGSDLFDVNTVRGLFHAIRSFPSYLESSHSRRAIGDPDNILALARVLGPTITESVLVPQLLSFLVDPVIDSSLDKLAQSDIPAYLLRLPSESILSPPIASVGAASGASNAPTGRGAKGADVTSMAGAPPHTYSLKERERLSKDLHLSALTERLRGTLARWLKALPGASDWQAKRACIRCARRLLPLLSPPATRSMLERLATMLVDPDETIALESIHAIIPSIRRNLLSRESLLSLSQRVSPLLLHPSPVLRRAAAQTFAAAWQVLGWPNALIRTGPILHPLLCRNKIASLWNVVETELKNTCTAVPSTRPLPLTADFDTVPPLCTMARELLKSLLPATKRLYYDLLAHAEATKIIRDDSPPLASVLAHHSKRHGTGILDILTQQINAAEEQIRTRSIPASNASVTTGKSGSNASLSLFQLDGGAKEYSQGLVPGGSLAPIADVCSFGEETASAVDYPAFGSLAPVFHSLRSQEAYVLGRLLSYVKSIAGPYRLAPATCERLQAFAAVFYANKEQAAAAARAAKFQRTATFSPHSTLDTKLSFGKSISLPIAPPESTASFKGALQSTMSTYSLYGLPNTPSPVPVSKYSGSIYAAKPSPVVSLDPTCLEPVDHNPMFDPHASLSTRPARPRLTAANRTSVQSKAIAKSLNMTTQLAFSTYCPYSQAELTNLASKVKILSYPDQRYASVYPGLPSSVYNPNYVPQDVHFELSNTSNNSTNPESPNSDHANSGEMTTPSIGLPTFVCLRPVNPPLPEDIRSYTRYIVQSIAETEKYARSKMESQALVTESSALVQAMRGISTSKSMPCTTLSLQYPGSSQPTALQDPTNPEKEDALVKKPWARCGQYLIAQDMSLPTYLNRNFPEHEMWSLLYSKTNVSMKGVAASVVYAVTSANAGFPSLDVLRSHNPFFTFSPLPSLSASPSPLYRLKNSRLVPAFRFQVYHGSLSFTNMLRHNWKIAGRKARANLLRHGLWDRQLVQSPNDRLEGSLDPRLDGIGGTGETSAYFYGSSNQQIFSESSAPLRYDNFVTFFQRLLPSADLSTVTAAAPTVPETPAYPSKSASGTPLRKTPGLLPSVDMQEEKLSSPILEAASKKLSVSDGIDRQTSGSFSSGTTSTQLVDMSSPIFTALNRSPQSPYARSSPTLGSAIDATEPSPTLSSSISALDVPDSTLAFRAAPEEATATATANAAVPTSTAVAPPSVPAPTRVSDVSQLLSIDTSKGVAYGRSDSAKSQRGRGVSIENQGSLKPISTAGPSHSSAGERRASYQGAESVSTVHKSGLFGDFEYLNADTSRYSDSPFAMVAERDNPYVIPSGTNTRGLRASPANLAARFASAAFAAIANTVPPGNPLPESMTRDSGFSASGAPTSLPPRDASFAKDLLLSESISEKATLTFLALAQRRYPSSTGTSDYLTAIGTQGIQPLVYIDPSYVGSNNPTMQRHDSMMHIPELQRQPASFAWDRRQLSSDALRDPVMFGKNLTANLDEADYLSPAQESALARRISALDVPRVPPSMGYLRKGGSSSSAGSSIIAHTSRLALDIGVIGSGPSVVTGVGTGTSIPSLPFSTCSDLPFPYFDTLQIAEFGAQFSYLTTRFQTVVAAPRDGKATNLRVLVDEMYSLVHNPYIWDMVMTAFANASLSTAKYILRANGRQGNNQGDVRGYPRSPLASVRGNDRRLDFGEFTLITQPRQDLRLRAPQTPQLSALEYNGYPNSMLYPKEVGSSEFLLVQGDDGFNKGDVVLQASPFQPAVPVPVPPPASTDVAYPPDIGDGSGYRGGGPSSFSPADRGWHSGLGLTTAHGIPSPNHFLPPTDAEVQQEVYRSDMQEMSLAEFGKSKSAAATGQSAQTPETVNVSWGTRPKGLLFTSCIGHSGPVTSMAVAGDHSFFVTGGDDGIINVWSSLNFNEIVYPKPMVIYDTHNMETLVYPHLAERIGTGKNRITDLIVCDNSTTVASGSLVGTVHVWSVDVSSVRKQGSSSASRPKSGGAGDSRATSHTNSLAGSMDENAKRQSALDFDIDMDPLACAQEFEVSYVTLPVPSGTKSVVRYEFPAKEGSVVALRHYDTVSQSVLVVAMSAGVIHGCDLRTQKEAFVAHLPSCFGAITSMELCPGISAHCVLVGTSRGVLALVDTRVNSMNRQGGGAFIIRAWRHSSFSPITSIYPYVTLSPRTSAPVAVFPNGQTEVTMARQLAVGISINNRETSFWNMETGACLRILRSLPANIDSSDAFSMPFLRKIDLIRGTVVPTDPLALFVSLKSLKEETAHLSTPSGCRVILCPLGSTAPSFYTIATGVNPASSSGSATAANATSTGSFMSSGVRSNGCVRRREGGYAIGYSAQSALVSSSVVNGDESVEAAEVLFQSDPANTLAYGTHQRAPGAEGLPSWILTGSTDGIVRCWDLDRPRASYTVCGFLPGEPRDIYEPRLVAASVLVQEAPTGQNGRPDDDDRESRCSDFSFASDLSDEYQFSGNESDSYDDRSDITCEEPEKDELFPRNEMEDGFSMKCPIVQPPVRTIFAQPLASPVDAQGEKNSVSNNPFVEGKGPVPAATTNVASITTLAWIDAHTRLLLVGSSDGVVRVWK